MAKQVFQCDSCPTTYPTEDLADWCNARHSLEGLADLLHKKLCFKDHAECCGYLDENWQNPRDARKKWKAKAKQLGSFLADFKIPDTYVKTLIDIFRG